MQTVRLCIGLLSFFEQCRAPQKRCFTTLFKVWANIPPSYRSELDQGCITSDLLGLAYRGPSRINRNLSSLEVTQDRVRSGKRSVAEACTGLPESQAHPLRTGVGLFMVTVFVQIQHSCRVKQKGQTCRQKLASQSLDDPDSTESQRK